MPACGASFLAHGGDTTCFSVSTPEGWILIDAGTGVAHVSHEVSESGCRRPITMLFTHFHMDHIMGLPVFAPLYSSGCEITLMADPRRDESWKDTLLTFMGQPFWPVGLIEGAAEMMLEDLPEQESCMDLYGTRISWFEVSHPQHCLAFRIEMPSATVVVATDAELSQTDTDSAFVTFCRDADVLVCDAQYTPEEYPEHRGWGHSTWRAACAAASKANVEQLVLTHHAPFRSDDDVRAIAEQAKQVFPNTVAATCGFTVRGD